MTHRKRLLIIKYHRHLT